MARQRRRISNFLQLPKWRRDYDMHFLCIPLYEVLTITLTLGTLNVGLEQRALSEVLMSLKSFLVRALR